MAAELQRLPADFLAAPQPQQPVQLIFLRLGQLQTPQRLAERHIITVQQMALKLLLRVRKTGYRLLKQPVKEADMPHGDFE
ncbi:hypothetical protein D3C74_404040 [compost metagenome]